MISVPVAPAAAVRTCAARFLDLYFSATPVAVPAVPPNNLSMTPRLGQGEPGAAMTLRVSPLGLETREHYQRS